MATTYTNLGPIYLTQEKFNTLLAANQLEAGREYKIIDWEAQEKLVAGDNITIADDGKTISAVAPDLSEYAKTTEVNTAVATAVNNLVDGAPEALDTLKELADNITILEGKQDTLIAGDNITIADDGKTISAQAGTTLTGTAAGQGFIYNGNEIIAQSGYAYEGEGTITHTWDGNTDDGTTYPTEVCNFYCVLEEMPFESADEAITALSTDAGFEYVVGSTTHTGTFTLNDNLFKTDDYIRAELTSILDNVRLYMYIVTADYAIVSPVSAELYKGVWFGYKHDDTNDEDWYQSKLYYKGDVVYQFDPRYIPTDNTVIRTTGDQDNISGEKSFYGGSLKFVGGSGSGIGIHSDGIEGYDYHISNTTIFKFRPLSGVSSAYVATYDWVQDQGYLTNHQQIRTINGNSLTDTTDDLEIKTFQPFPDDFNTGENGGSLTDFIESIENSSGAKEGMAYLGSIYDDVLPWTTGGNAECKVEYMTDWIALVTVSSSSESPYLWVMNTAEGVWRGVQGALTAGTGIKINENVISVDSDAGIAIYDSRIADANAWLTNGYTKTRNTTDEATATLNLPALCTDSDRWGVLLYVAENNANHAGLQQYFPIDGTYKGRIFYRSVTGLGDGDTPQFGEWHLVPWSDEIPAALTAGTNIDITDNTISATIPNASADTVGGLKAYYDSTNKVLYLTNDGSDPTPTPSV